MLVTGWACVNFLLFTSLQLMPFWSLDLTSCVFIICCIRTACPWQHRSFVTSYTLYLSFWTFMALVLLALARHSQCTSLLSQLCTSWLIVLSKLHLKSSYRCHCFLSSWPSLSLRSISMNNVTAFYLHDHCRCVLSPRSFVAAFYLHDQYHCVLSPWSLSLCSISMTLEYCRCLSPWLLWYASIFDMKVFPCFLVLSEFVADFLGPWSNNLWRSPRLFY